jgi:hypothetical protein
MPPAAPRAGSSDFVSVPASPRGRDLVIHDDKGTHRIDILHVVEVHEPDAGEGETSPEAGSKAEDDGG